MNKTVTINLSGIVFHIDENAYEVLRKYLENLKAHFAGTQGREEIIADIESRMAEMFSEKVSEAKNVIMMEDVQQVIDVMGRPEQVAGEDELPQEYIETRTYERIRKRLYRNPDDKIIGGVCSGIAAYFDIDPIWLRLAFVISIIFAGTGIWVYLILWIVLPLALTPSEKLQMKGEPVNVETIKKSVQDEMESLRKKGASFASEVYSEENRRRTRYAGERFGNFLGDLFRALGKFIAAVFGFLITVLSIGILLALTVGIFSGIGLVNFAIPHEITDMVLTRTQLWLLIIGGLLAIGIPFTLLLLNGLKILFKIKLNLKAIGAIMAGFWILGLGLCIITGIQIGSEFSKDSAINQTQKISAGSTANIILKANNHWTTGDDQWRSYNDWDDLIVIGSNDDSVVAPFVRVDIEQSEDDSVYLVQKYYSRGKTYEEARRLASQINYSYSVTDSVITLSNYFTMSTEEKFRGQNVRLVLKIPVGKSVKLDRSIGWMLDDIANVTETWDRDMLNHNWKMTSDGLECQDCPLDMTHNDGDDHAEEIHIGPGTVTIEKDGKVIEVSGGELKIDTL